MVKVAVLLAALGLASLWAFKAHETRAAEHRLGAIASELAERPVRIECQGFWAALFDVNGRVGEVQFPDGVHPADHAYLTRSICQMLRHFRPSRIDCLTGRDWASLTFVEISNDPCGRRSLPLVEAALTLAHESMHLRGYRDEATTQCHALDALRLVAERLGASGTEGDAMARYALALQPGMPTEYQFSSCPDLVPPPV